jgi:FlaA1/EpsC-like NDP-sugar epimerase
MNIAQLRVDESAWSDEARHGHPRVPATVRRRQVLPGVASALVIAADVALVAGTFMLAYVGRFAADESLPTLGLDRYLRLAVLVGLLASVLLATHGLYNLERPQAWPVRLRGIASSSSTALVLAFTASFFLGDQAFSRLWLASGWALSVVVLVIWRVLAHRLYETLRDALFPANRVLIVGANRLGRELADELKSGYHVVGYVDNGSDLERLELPLLGPIAQLEELVQAYAVDELIIALPNGRREQVSGVLARGFRRHVEVKLLPELEGRLPERFQVHHFGGRQYIGYMPAAAVSWVKRAMDLVVLSLSLIQI